MNNEVSPAQPTNIENNSQQIKNSGKSDSIFVVSLALISAVIIISLIVVILNYFQIIKLENINPGFSILPIVSSPTPTPQASQANLPKQFVITPPVLDAKAKQVTSLIKQDVQSKYAMTAAAGSHTTEDANHIITFSWALTDNNKPMMGTLKVKNENGASDKTLYISATTDVSSPITESEATDFVKRYFTNPVISKWSCSQDGAKSTCISETITSTQKIKLIVSTTTDLPGRVFIRNCSATSSTKLFNESNYCLL